MFVSVAIGSSRPGMLFENSIDCSKDGGRFFVRMDNPNPLKNIRKENIVLTASHSKSLIQQAATVATACCEAMLPCELLCGPHEWRTDRPG